jgi:hypothetical protein
MLIRCAARTMAGGMLLTGLVAGTALLAGGVGAALLARRLWEERKGWKQGAESAEPPPMAEPGLDAPAA